MQDAPFGASKSFLSAASTDLPELLRYPRYLRVNYEGRLLTNWLTSG